MSALTSFWMAGLSQMSPAIGTDSPCRRGCTKWWKVAEQISDGEFRMLQGLTDHRYVLPRIQEYIAATNRGDSKKAQKWGRKKKHKGKPHRYLK